MTKVNKITIDSSISHDGYERYVEGYYNIDNNVYKFELDTYAGNTNIHLMDGEDKINLEYAKDLNIFGKHFPFDEEVGIEIYDEILTYVHNNGYAFIGKEFE